MLLRALRFVIGAVVAFAIWWYATPAYNALLCDILRQFGMRAVAVDRAVRATRPDAREVQVPADQLTYNFVLFVALAAAVPTRAVWRLIIALIVVLAIHPLAIAVTIERTFSPQSQFWLSLDFLYRLGGMFAIAFAAWYAALGSHLHLAAISSSRRTRSRTAAKTRQNR
jgi:hypothetical protein